MVTGQNCEEMEALPVRAMLLHLLYIDTVMPLLAALCLTETETSVGMHRSCKSNAALAEGAPSILALKLAPALSGAHALADTSCAWCTTARCILTGHSMLSVRVANCTPYSMSNLVT